MATKGKIYFVDKDFTDAEVAELFGFPSIFILKNNTGKIIKQTAYDVTGAKSITTYQNSGDRVLTLGAITATTTFIDLPLHSSGINSVELSGNTRSKNTADHWDFPAVVEEKLFTVYALDDANIFHLAMDGEEIPAGALIIRSFLISEHGAVEMNDDFKLYSEDAWRNFTITSNDVFTINMDNALAVNFAITVAPGVTEPKIGLIRQKAGKSFRPGVEFKIRNFSATDIALVETEYTDGLFKHLTFEGGIAKKNSDTLLKEIAGSVSVLKIGGGASKASEVENDSSVTGASVKDALDTLIGHKSSVVDKMLHYWDSTAQKWLSSGLKFVSGVVNQLEFTGRIKADSIVLPANSNPVVANRLRSDGSRLKYANDLSVEKDVAYSDDIYLQTNILKRYLHNSNIELTPTAIDYSTGYVTCAAHGLPINTVYYGGCIPNDFKSAGFIAATFWKSIPYEYNNTAVKIKIIDATTVQILDASNNFIAVNQTSTENNANLDISKWHIEIMVSFSNFGIPKGHKNIRVQINGLLTCATSVQLYLINVYDLANNVVENVIAGDSSLSTRSRIDGSVGSAKGLLQINAVFAFDLYTGLNYCDYSSRVQIRAAGASNFSYTAQNTIFTRSLLAISNNGIEGIKSYTDYMYANGSVVTVYKT